MGLIEDEGLAETIAVRDAKGVGKRGLHLVVWALEHGFETPDMTVISEQDVLGDRLIRGAKKRKKARELPDGNPKPQSRRSGRACGSRNWALSRA